MKQDFRKNKFSGNLLNLLGKQPDNHQIAINEILKEADTCGHKRKEGGGHHNISLIKALIQILKQPHLRKAFIIGTLSLQIIVGIWPIIYISTDLLEAHFDANASQYSSFAFICANFVASVIGTCSVEKFGRRPMLIWCGIANTLCLCSYILFDRMTSQRSIFFVNPQFKYGCVFSLIAYGITYGAALGPIAFFITSELVPQRFRSLVQSIVFMTNTIINFVFSFITLPLYEIIDVWSFIPLFIIPSTISICYLIKELPETKGFIFEFILSALLFIRLYFLPLIYLKTCLLSNSLSDFFPSLQLSQRSRAFNTLIC
ncbi:unnamed protein product [Meloidogyne enterolobii]|uniref:Uncharacterized protein n=1 Tax=Meloidogyne enterolobii TaxID=390850 RepID=A0ACB0XZU0_MELEN